MTTITQKLNRRKFHLLLAAVGTTGIAGLFLPFTMNVSAMEIDWGLWRLTDPALLSFPITIATILWIISGSFSKAEKVIAYIFGLVAVGLIFLMIFNSESGPIDYKECLILAIPTMVIVSGAYVVCGLPQSI